MINQPFRGSTAIARGLLTRGELRSKRYLQLFRDIYVRATDDLPDLALRSRAAAMLIGHHGALSGYSAAELLGAVCAPRKAPAELVSPGVRPRPDLLVSRSTLAPSEIWTVQGCRVTSPARTAWDLVRRLDRIETIVAVDTLARIGRFDPELLLAYRTANPGARRCSRPTEIVRLADHLDEVVRLADRRAESPMETRLRLLLIDHGLPRPVVQHPLRDRYGAVVARLDLAYPEARLAIEYDGERSHRGRRRADNLRDIAVAELGWETMRFCDTDVYLTPHDTAAAVQRVRAVRIGP